MMCDFVDAETPDAAGRRKVRCSRCGFTSPAPTLHPPERCFRTCDKLGAGDFLALGLSAVGITKERIAYVRGMLGLAGCGGCPQKQEALNELGKKLGL